METHIRRKRRPIQGRGLRLPPSFRRRYIRHLLSSDHYEAVTEYLTSPRQSGLWELEAEWKESAGISSDIWDSVSEDFEAGEEAEVSLGESQYKFMIDEDDREKAQKRVRNKITFLFELFRYIHTGEIAYGPRPSSPPHPDGILLASVDQERIRDEYSQAFATFTEKIYLNGFLPIIRTDEPFATASGLIVLRKGISDGNDNAIVVNAFSHDSLEALGQFLYQLGKIGDWSAYRVFSPEEKLLGPYFEICQYIYPQFLPDNRLHRFFERAFEEYESGEPENTITAIGRIAEDYLTQVYETLYRQPAPASYSMGQLFDRIESEAETVLDVSDPEAPDPRPLYEQINTALEDDTDSSELSVRTAETLRDVLGLIVKERRYTRELIRGLEEETTDSGTIFPNSLRVKLADLIRYRNAAAHKSRMPLGQFEAQRALFSTLSFISWWHELRNEIDWRLGRKEILKTVADRAG